MTDVRAGWSASPYLMREGYWHIVPTADWKSRRTSKTRGGRNPTRTNRNPFSSKEKLRIVLDGLSGKYSIAELCRREGISQVTYHEWNTDFMEAGKQGLTNKDKLEELRPPEKEFE